MTRRIQKLIKFLEEIEKLQRVKRIIHYEDGSQENSAEHSWHVAMFVLILGHEINPRANLDRMIKMALIHDLVEIYAGDTYLFDDKERESKVERELAAAKKLFAQLPDDVEQEFWQLFNEFEALKTPEAKIVRSLDYLQPISHNLIHNGATWEKRNLTARMNDDKKRPLMTHDPVVLSIYEYMHDQALKRKLYADQRQ